MDFFEKIDIMENMSEMREEKDSMGVMYVPSETYYGAQTARALENFEISDRRIPQPFLKAMAQIKKAAALVHGELVNDAFYAQRPLTCLR